MSLDSSLRQSNPEALNLSQQATQYLEAHASTGTATIPIPFFSHPESTDIWLRYENLLLSCLRTGDDKAAHTCLEKLIGRFGVTTERVMGLRALYQEAVAQDENALQKVLEEYSTVLAEDPTNTPVAKRRIALLRSLMRINDAIDALIELLNSSPTDIEAWAELADLYLSQNLFTQGIFCLEEVLLVAPNAWNIPARLGEALFMFATNGSEGNEGRIMSEAMRRFCRSVELCDDYVRGYYGLKMTSDRILSRLPEDSTPTASADSDNGSTPQLSTSRKLNELATSKLAQLVRTTPSHAQHTAEIIAARKLLDEATWTGQR